LLSPQSTILPLELSEALETQAQHIVAQLLARRSVSTSIDATPSLTQVDVDSLELVKPRRVGLE